MPGVMFGNVEIASDEVCGLHMECGYVIRTSARKFVFANPTDRAIPIKRRGGKLDHIPAGGSVEVKVGGVLCEMHVDGQYLQIFVTSGGTTAQTVIKSRLEDDCDMHSKVMEQSFSEG